MRSQPFLIAWLVLLCFAPICPAGLISFSGIDANLVTSTGQTFSWSDNFGASGTVHVRLVTAPNALLSGYPKSDDVNTIRHDGTVLKDAFNGSTATSSIVHEYLFTFDRIVDLYVENAETLHDKEFNAFRTNGSAWTGGVTANGSFVTINGVGTDYASMEGRSNSSVGYAQFTSHGVTQLRWYHGTNLGFPNASGEAIGVNVLRSPAAVPEPSSILFCATIFILLTVLYICRRIKWSPQETKIVPIS